ncbi:MAG TPA: type II secretion system F family protein, partial [Candidatus Paceibacterota bacterium]
TGITISEYMNNDRSLFPTLVPDMLSIGEKTGTLGIMFGNIARIYDEEIDSFIKQISSFIEPILMIFMGIIVGSIALSIILPIYEITNHLSN